MGDPRVWLELGPGSGDDSSEEGVLGLEAGSRCGEPVANARVLGGMFEPEPNVCEDESEDEELSWEPEARLEGVATGGVGRGRRLVVA